MDRNDYYAGNDPLLNHPYEETSEDYQTKIETKIADKMASLNYAQEKIKENPEKIMGVIIDNRFESAAKDKTPKQCWEQFDQSRNPDASVLSDRQELNETRYRLLQRLGFEIAEEEPYSLIPQENWVNFQVGENNLTIAHSPREGYENVFLVRSMQLKPNSDEYMLTENILVAKDKQMLKEKLEAKLSN